jgi:AbrB family looped-hinge helix DNA binding protein
MAATQTLVRIEEDGRVRLPPEVRERLGLKVGDLVAIEEKAEGVVITSPEVVITKALAEIGEALKEQGLTLEDMIERGREIRGQLLREHYGLTDSDLS